MRPRKLSLLVLMGAVLIALTGCGGSSTNTTDNNPAQSEANQSGATQSTASSSSSSGKALALAADPTGQLKYDKTSLTASSGNVAIDFTNDSSTAHNVTVTDSSGKKLGATPDITKSKATLNLKGLKPGTYTFFCSIPGHEQAGMKGTLTVK